MISIETRRRLVAAEVTLNGERAAVCGALNDYATVATLPQGAAAEWAWETVERIVADGGAFKL